MGKGLACREFPHVVGYASPPGFVGYRHPARLVIYDGRTGKELSSGDMTGDADDLYNDEGSKKVYVSGGAGAVSIFQAGADGVYKQITNIPTRSGARTSLLVPQLKTLVVVARAAAGKDADLLVYSLTP